MNFKKVQKYVCCTLDLTIASRIIGFVGIIISVLLMTVLLNDKYFDKKENYEISRKTALALGLDWQHFHSMANTAYQNDPEGKKISIIVIFYACAFLFLNLLLCFATITSDWRCTVPWLTCEFVGCFSKFGALIYHFYNDQNELNNIFIIGSIFYIVIIIWWWLVVFLAQLSWRNQKDDSTKIELSTLSSIVSDTLPGRIRYFQDTVKEEKLDSPGPYSPNRLYALI